MRVEYDERYFKFLDYIASFLGFGAFFHVFLTKLQTSIDLSGGIFRAENRSSFNAGTVLPYFLILLFGTIYFFSRHSVRMELEIGKLLFPPGRVPRDWGGPTRKALAFISVIGFLFLYSSLMWFADNIKIVSFAMFAIACNDWRTRYLIGDGLKRFFSDEKYAPHSDDRDYELIRRRRAVAIVFLFGKPHLLKETGRVVGCGLAFAISIYGLVYREDQFTVAAYYILITTLMLNEIVTLRWRFRMFRDLEAISD